MRNSSFKLKKTQTPLELELKEEEEDRLRKNQQQEEEKSSSNWVNTSSSSSVARHLRIAALWCRAASRSDPNALFRLGLLFETGEWGFEVEDVHQAAWAEAAATAEAEAVTEATAAGATTTSSFALEAATTAAARQRRGSRRRRRRRRRLVAGPLLAGDPFESFGVDEARAAAYYSRAAGSGHAKAAFRLANL